MTWLCLPPFGFTPHQVRTEFRLRDLELLKMAWNSLPQGG